MKNTVIVSAVVALVVALVAGSLFGGTEKVVERVIEQVGTASGPDHSNREFFHAGLATGGRVATTSTAATYTTAAGDFNGTPTYIDWTPNVNTTVSLSATSTHAYVPNVGDMATVVIRNASSTATATITFAAVDVNTDLQYTEATGGDLVLSGLDLGTLTFIRESANLVTVLFNEFTEAD